MPALTTAEATQVRAALDAADPAGKARIYSDIVAATSGGTRAATLAKLGAKGVDGMVEAYAGAMTGLDPAIGESIIRGQAAMKIKDAYNPMKDGNKDEQRGHRQIPPGRRVLAGGPHRSAGRLRGHARRGHRARGRPAATDPNFKTAKFTDALFQRATADVTGGIVTAQRRRSDRAGARHEPARLRRQDGRPDRCRPAGRHDPAARRSRPNTSATMRNWRACPTAAIWCGSAGTRSGRSTPSAASA
jgi:hypothetical protein